MHLIPQPHGLDVVLQLLDVLELRDQHPGQDFFVPDRRHHTSIRLPCELELRFARIQRAPEVLYYDAVAYAFWFLGGALRGGDEEGPGVSWQSRVDEFVEGRVHVVEAYVQPGMLGEFREAHDENSFGFRFRFRFGFGFDIDFDIDFDSDFIVIRFEPSLDILFLGK